MILFLSGLLLVLFFVASMIVTRTLQAVRKEQKRTSDCIEQSLRDQTSLLIEVSNISSTVTDISEKIAEQKRDWAANIKSLEAANSKLFSEVKNLQDKLAEIARSVDNFEELCTSLAAVQTDQQYYLLPIIGASNSLSHKSFEHFFEPPEPLENFDHGDVSQIACDILGLSNIIKQASDAIARTSEHYIKFSPELLKRLDNGAKLMHSADGWRAIVVENGKIIGHGIVTQGTTVAGGIASAVSFATTVAYYLVARDTQKQLRSMNAELKRAMDFPVRKRQARL